MTVKGSSDRVDDQSGERTENLEENIEERAEDRNKEHVDEPTAVPVGESSGEAFDEDEDSTPEVEGGLAEGGPTEADVEIEVGEKRLRAESKDRDDAWNRIVRGEEDEALDEAKVLEKAGAPQETEDRKASCRERV